MMAASRPDRRSGKLLTVGADGRMRHLLQSDLSMLLGPGDLVVANDAATMPASLSGRHERTGGFIEVRLAAFAHAGDHTRFIAIAFGAGDYRTVTEERPMPPVLLSGDRLLLGPLLAIVEEVLDHPRLVTVRFSGAPAQILAGLARHGRPIQYAHVPTRLELWDMWTAFAAEPFAFEPPSAGFALDWRTLLAWQQRGIGFATLTHAAGISSTGDPTLDRRLPFDEPYVIPDNTASAIRLTKERGNHLIAVGTTVVRALESAAAEVGVSAGRGIARDRIGPETQLRVVDAILTGMHEPGESHFELLRAFLGDSLLQRVHRVATEHVYLSHEFGDSLLVERSYAA